PEFNNFNPSLEHFARILCKTIATQIETRDLTTIAIKIWENESAWAEFREEF
ncbi:MAG: 6-carboxytetrahydropterin synthase, partial [Desulfobacterales bacterium]|nr:6-carboxytetrahydropterin synthase [Desulfobacterales bacterium]